MSDAPVTLAPMASTLQVLRPAPQVLAFYDGRVADTRLWSAAPNWLDDGAYALGICSYAVVDGTEALIYDTHISLEHARIIRRTLEEAGVRRMRVVLSHWHDDHVAGNEVFADCEIIANALTAETLREKQATLEAGDPPIRPLVMPNRIFSGEITLSVGTHAVTLRQMDIHSRDGTVGLLPGGLLLAGDTLEDPITYVDEPDRLAQHLGGLAEMATWPLTRILPNHGAEAVIAAGGYGPSLIGATIAYVETLLATRSDPSLAEQDLRTLMAPQFASGALGYFGPYEAVHRANVGAVLACASPRP